MMKTAKKDIVFGSKEKEQKESEDYDSSEEDIITKRGVMEMEMKKKKWIAVYCVLIGGTFYYYFKNTDDSEPSGKIDLEGSTVVSPAKNAKTKFSFAIQRNEELLFVGSCTGALETEQWVKAIQDSLDKEKTEAPGVGGKKKQKKNWKHMFISSPLFPTKIKSLSNDETSALLGSLKRVVKAESNSTKKADDLEKNIWRITLKSYLLLEESRIKAEDFLEADKSLREAFELLVRIYNGKERLKPEKINAALKKVESIFKQTEELLIHLLSPYLTAKNMLRIKAIFSTIGEVKFLENVLMDTNLRLDLDKLVTSMETYTLNYGNF